MQQTLPSEAPVDEARDELERLLGAVARPAAVLENVPRVGTLVAFTDPCTPLVAIGDGPARPARTTVDLLPEHIGADVLLVCEGGVPDRPIVIGRLREARAWPAAETPPQVEVDADGRRMTVAVKEQLVLRCGLASITLTAAGKVLIQGTYVSSRSSGVNRIKGGSVQIN